MSVVARQSFKYSIIGYLGFLLGTIAAIWIFPQDLEYYGKGLNLATYNYMQGAGYDINVREWFK